MNKMETSDVLSSELCTSRQRVPYKQSLF